MLMPHYPDVQIREPSITSPDWIAVHEHTQNGIYVRTEIHAFDLEELLTQLDSHDPPARREGPGTP